MAATQDLTMRMIPFLDRHLVFPLIEFLELKEVKYFLHLRKMWNFLIGSFF